MLGGFKRWLNIGALGRLLKVVELRSTTYSPTTYPSATLRVHLYFIIYNSSFNIQYYSFLPLQNALSFISYAGNIYLRY